MDRAAPSATAGTQGLERQKILDREALNVVREIDLATLRAELIWSERTWGSSSSSIWLQINKLADLAHQTTYVQDPKKARALLFVTKTWGLEKVNRYQWRQIGRGTIEALSTLAKCCPDWTLAAQALNAAMISRHIKEVQTDGAEGQRIGGFRGNEKVKAEDCPLNRQDGVALVKLPMLLKTLKLQPMRLMGFMGTLLLTAAGTLGPQPTPGRAVQLLRELRTPQGAALG
ncbi:hypothetical protein B0A55_09951 [Friedmanniomyces simplex]|uniref:Uncharacterized protein n=1 Tax=Friedmanniomyces simplex TaxID=329884 RepID=A0A4U0XAL5_9PEZI|nr:hypothetical protein B0A55_09951 [Friedmanniomyces simplex]